MSIECNNTTPLGSRDGEEILKSTSDALQDAIIDLASLVPDADDPTVSVDRESAIDATNAIINILNSLNDEGILDEYPSLKDKFDSEEGITVTDIAQFALDNNIDLNELKEDLLAFNETRSNASGTDQTGDGGLDPNASGIAVEGALGSSATGSTIDTGSGLSTVLTSGDVTSGSIGDGSGSGGLSGDGSLLGGAGGSGDGTGTGGVGSGGLLGGTGTGSGTGGGLASNVSTRDSGLGGTGTGTGTGSDGAISTDSPSYTGGIGQVGGDSRNGPGGVGGTGTGGTAQVLGTGLGTGTGTGGVGTAGISGLSGTGGTGTGTGFGTGVASGTGTGVGTSIGSTGISSDPRNGPAGVGISGGAGTGTGGLGSSATSAGGLSSGGVSTGLLGVAVVAGVASGAINTNFSSNTSSNSFGNSGLNRLQNVQNTIGGPGSITENFISNRARTSSSGGFFSATQALAIARGSSALPIIVTNLLVNLDFQFATNLGQKLTGGVCGAYNDVLADLTKAFAVVKKGGDLLADITNLLEKDLKKLADSIKQKGILQTLLDILEKVIEGAIKVAKGVIIAAVGSTIAILKGMESAASAIMKKINKIMRNINDYMKDASVQKIIADMKKLVADLAASFERLTPQNVANLMFRLCQMAQDLQAKLMAPALKVNKMANSFGREAKAVKSQSAVNTQQAVKYGAIRVSDEERQNKKRMGIRKYQKTRPSNREADYVTDGKPTEQEIATIQSVGEGGLGGNVTFSSEVVADEGWKDVNDNVYARLLRIVDQTGESYEVQQAFVKRKTGGDKLGGIQMNSHNSGYAIDIGISEGNRDDTVVAASRAGFTGIGVYSSHIHLDLASRRGWQKGYSGKKETEIQALLDKHTIDGFKKKRS
jgi:hypothetical protein